MGANFLKMYILAQAFCSCTAYTRRVFDQGNGLDTTALSVALFDEGRSCGGCYEVPYHGSVYCKPGAVPVAVTATNLCPANYSKPNENWCKPICSSASSPTSTWRSQPMLPPVSAPLRKDLTPTKGPGSAIPVQYRRSPCAKRGRVTGGGGSPRSCSTSPGPGT
ncbi:hypothetical protein BAE44_0011535 [Dichanthelium oligosanthes]|uniref:Expansin n=1 Tax=Dichanthelium oligosanthes TaxID=888268 RepID=A0A1E5VQN7_9POAL|nr:hypothetical protein BAE44_0011535 [Dichanthelium oligosanthes]